MASGIAVSFSAEFIAHIPRFKRAIRAHRAMSWARRCSLEDDLIQLSLIDLARVESRFDPSRATSPVHFLLAVLASRVSDCAGHLRRMHRDLNSSTAVECEEKESGCDRKGSFEDLQTDADPTFAQIQNAEAGLTLRGAIRCLPPRQRQVMELVLADNTDREIAEHLGVSIQAVNRARLGAVNAIRRLIGRR